ncbi:hypothetical protein [Siansivirga zeaxanthinifaciens]|uniref:Uncharacterized protein n=1 Tax=Siansivirga zeaxanthinifaciens CC-SAMT-1 TaxID=1454006 RepID=A0A0C5WPI2_9FLAO|nr:hypothetical protein [Siansivirga zeaxanthinifaciens]AJR04815.1 hypothetical protein AW14_06575 [Siansivirga zeaxanthinifaciens CC-SAMT-1]
MKKTLFIFIAILGCFSCSNSETQVLNGILTGEFIEITPESNRTTLIFSSNNNQLQEKRITDGENPITRTFSIRLLDSGMIELSSNEADEESPRVLHYKTINNNKFEIGNINQNDPENTIMIFERN